MSWYVKFENEYWTEGYWTRNKKLARRFLALDEARAVAAYWNQGLKVCRVVRSKRPHTGQQ